MNDVFDLTGKAALIAGGSKGIGLAICKELVGRGCSVALTSRDEYVARRIADELTALSPNGAQAIGLPMDLAVPSSWKSVVDAAVERLGGLDSFVCSAALDQASADLGRIQQRQWTELFEANVIATAGLADLAAAQIATRQSGGAIVLVGSASAFRGSDTYPAYAMTKSVLPNLVQHLTARWAPHGVRANCIAPSLIETEFSADLWTDDAKVNEMRRNTYPLKRLGKPADIAGLVVALISPAGAWTTGQTLVVDGGMMSAVGCYRHREADRQSARPTVHS